MAQLSPEELIRDVINKGDGLFDHQLLILRRVIPRSQLAEALEKLTHDFNLEGIWAVNALAFLDKTRARAAATRWLGHPNHNARSWAVDTLIAGAKVLLSAGSLAWL